METYVAFRYIQKRVDEFLNKINILTSEQDLLFQTINHVSNEELKRNILETLRDSLTNESSSKPFQKKKKNNF